MTITQQNRAATLSLLLAYRMHQRMAVELIMTKVKKCCERLLERTIDGEMIDTYSKIIRAIYDRRYGDVMIMLHVAEDYYYRVYLA